VDAAGEHERAGELAARLDVGELVAVGDEARPLVAGYEAARGAGAGRARWVPDVASAVALLRDELRGGDVVLVKASRAAGLERIAAALTDEEVAR
jgi:UDP-N-acetylmuramoyl-tripeptide--D-alanyl-D-alanine ligase